MFDVREEVEKCKDRDLLENMLAEMAGEFPALSRYCWIDELQSKLSKRGSICTSLKTQKAINKLIF